jgi:hypothetical protein
MLYLAWFSAVVYTLSMIVSNYTRVKKGEGFAAFLLGLVLQVCILTCLISFALLL